VTGPLLLSPALRTDPTDLDPLGLDPFYADPIPLIHTHPHDLIDLLAPVVPVMAATTDVPVAMAILRDVDPPLCVLERWTPGKWREIPGMEDALIHLGKVRAGIPRSDNDLYGVINPAGPRLRTLTRLDAEVLLIDALRAGGRGLLTVLHRLSIIADWVVGRRSDREAVDAAGQLAPAWDPMVEAAALMARRMPLDVFSHDLIPWLVPLAIGGVTYRAPTGAQFSVCEIDHVAWGVEIARKDREYREYSAAFRAECPPAVQALADRTVVTLGRHSLITALETRPPVGHPAARHAVLDGIDALLRRIRDFRAVHQRFALDTLTLRPGAYGTDVKQGSGMQGAPQFVPLLTYTRKARERVAALRK
jgi:hypothetical protein